MRPKGTSTIKWTSSPNMGDSGELAASIWAAGDGGIGELCEIIRQAQCVRSTSADSFQV